MVSADELLRFTLFAGLERAFLEKLASISENKAARKDEWLFHEGDSADALYVIDSGSIDLKVKLDEKRAMYATLNTLTDGNPVGWSALVKPHVYTLGALASSDTRLVRLDGSKLRTLLEERPDQGYILMNGITQTMGKRMNILSERVPDLSLRFILSSILFSVGVGTGILAGLSALVALYAAFDGHLVCIPLVLMLLILPVASLWLAGKLAPAQ